jgi:hypothetical protein
MLGNGDEEVNITTYTDGKVNGSWVDGMTKVAHLALSN